MSFIKPIEDWSQDPQYMALPADQKASILNNYFERELADQDFYQLPDQEQSQIKQNFLRQNMPQEQLPNNWTPSGDTPTASMVNKFVSDTIASDPFLAQANAATDVDISIDSPTVRSNATNDVAMPSFPPSPETGGIGVESQPTVLDETIEAGRESLTSGIYSVLATPFTAVEATLGATAKEDTRAYRMAQRAGDFLLEKAEEHQGLPEDLQGKNPINNPEILYDPRYIASGLGQMLPSFAAAMIPGMAAMKYGRLVAGTVGGVAGGIMEGVNTYKEALQRGATKEEAFDAMMKMTIGSGILNAIGFDSILSKYKGKGLGKLVKHTVSALTEGITEWGEGPLEGKILGMEGDEYRQKIKNELNVVLPAMLMGGGGSVVSDVATDVSVSKGKQSIIKDINQSLDDAQSDIRESTALPDDLVEPVVNKYRNKISSEIDALDAETLNEENVNRIIEENTKLLNAEINDTQVNSFADLAVNAARINLQESGQYSEDEIEQALDTYRSDLVNGIKANQQKAQENEQQAEQPFSGMPTTLTEDQTVSEQEAFSKEYQDVLSEFAPDDEQVVTEPQVSPEEQQVSPEEAARIDAEVEQELTPQGIGQPDSDPATRNRGVVYHATPHQGPIAAGMLEPSAPMQGKDKTGVYFSEDPDWEGKFASGIRLVYDQNQLPPTERGPRYDIEKELISQESIPVTKEAGLLRVELETSLSRDHILVGGLIQDDPRFDEGVPEEELAVEYMKKEKNADIKKLRETAQYIANKLQVPVVLRDHKELGGNREIIRPEPATIEPPVDETQAASGTITEPVVGETLSAPESAEPSVQMEEQMLKPPTEKEYGAPPSLVNTQRYPVVQIPVADIKVDAERFQFKGDTDERGVKQGGELEGEFDELAAGNLLLWQSNEGDLYVVNGHHRLAKANEYNVPVVNAQIIKESDGITPRMAKVIGADTNIQQGRGDIYDHAEYFRNVPEAERETRRRNRGLAGRGYKLGVNSGDALYTLFRNRKITEDQALGIIDAAGSNEELQAVGLRILQRARENGQKLDKQDIANLVRANSFAMQNRQEVANVAQTDMFGGTFDSALQLSEDLARIAKKHQDDLKEKILTLRPLKKETRLAELQKLGFDNYEGAMRQLQEYEREQSRWDRWDTDPELRQQILNELNQTTGRQESLFEQPPQTEQPQPQESATPRESQRGEQYDEADLLLSSQGNTYKTPQTAQRRANKEGTGYTVVPFRDGYAVLKPQTQVQETVLESPTEAQQASTDMPAQSKGHLFFTIGEDQYGSQYKINEYFIAPSGAIMRAGSNRTDVAIGTDGYRMDARRFAGNEADLRRRLEKPGIEIIEDVTQPSKAELAAQRELDQYEFEREDYQVSPRRNTGFGIESAEEADDDIQFSTRRENPQIYTDNFKNWFGDWENDPQNASKVVDENGKPMVVHHGTGQNFNIFDLNKTGLSSDAGWFGRGFYFTPNPQFSTQYATYPNPNIMPVYLDIRKPYDWRDKTGRGLGVSNFQISDEKRREILRQGYDGVFVYDGFVQIKDRLTDDQWSAILDYYNEKNITGIAAHRSSVEETLRKGIAIQDFRTYYGDALADKMPVERRLREIVAMYPTQIKSAIGNTGAFGVNEPDINFRSTDYASTGRQSSDPGLGVVRVAQLADDIQNKINIQLHIVSDGSELPTEGLQQRVEEEAREGNIVNGFYSRGLKRIFILADNIRNEEELLKLVIPHEVAHYGIEGLLGEEGYAAFTAKLINDKKIGKVIKERAKQSGKTLRYEAREWFAEMAEGENIENMPKTWLEKIILWLRNAIRKKFPNLRYSKTELRDLLRQSFTFAQQGPAAEMRIGRDEEIEESALSDTEELMRKEAAHQEWYSQMQNVITNKLPEKGTVPGFRKAIESWANKGEFKAEELEWSGLLTDPTSPLSKDVGRVTKQEVVDWLDANNVRVEIVDSGTAEDGLGISQDQWEINWELVDADESGRGYRTWYSPDLAVELTDNIDIREDPESSNPYDLYINGSWRSGYGSLESAQEDVRDMYATLLVDEGVLAESDTKFSKYQEPGGSNYREIRITLPEKPRAQSEIYQVKESFDGSFVVVNTETNSPVPFIPPLGTREEAQELADQRNRDETKLSLAMATFTSPHFPEKNILAHLRVNDRVDADGNKVLFVEEIQSDWHEQGRKEGYQGDDSPKWYIIGGDGFNVFEDVLNDPQFPRDGMFETKEAAQDYLFRANQQGYRFRRVTSSGSQTSVPNAPFKKTWPLLAFKKALRMAAEGGYDKIAWTTGAQQAKRYDLSRSVDSIIYTQTTAMKEPSIKKSVFIDTKDGGTITLYLDKDGIVFDSVFANDLDLKGKPLSDVIGKDIANEIMSSDEGTIEGEGLSVGGSGMKAFYDKMIPNIINKYVKKWGGRTTASEINGNEQPSVTITPAMREAALRGQPLFRTRKDINTLLRQLKDVYAAIDNLPPTASDNLRQRLDNKRQEIEENIQDASQDLQFSMRRTEAPEVNAEGRAPASIEYEYIRQGLINSVRAGGQENLSDLKKKVFDYFRQYMPRDRVSRSRASTLLAGISASNNANELATALNNIYEAINGKAGFRINSEGDVVRTFLDLPPETKLQHLRRFWQDSMSRLQYVQKHIEKQTGEKITPEMDAYQKDILQIGRATYRVEEFTDKMINGKNSFLGRLDDAGIDYNVFGLYLMAKHVPERRKVLLERKIANAKRESDKVKWRTILNDKQNPFGAGMSEEVASQIVNDVERDHADIADFATEFYNNVTKEALQARLDAGLISQQQYDILNNTYKEYVPLKGTVDSPATAGFSRLSGYMSTGIKRAAGRLSEAENPFVQAMVDYTDAIARAEENRVRQSFYRLVEAHPDQTVWQIEKTGYQPVFDSNGDIRYYDPLRQLANNVVEVRFDGQSNLITIYDTPLAEAMKGVTWGKSIPLLNTMNAYLRNVITSLSPEFMIGNFERDLQMAITNISGEQSTKLAGQTLKDLRRAMGGIINNLYNRGGEWSDVYDDLKKTGGKVSWMNLESPAELIARIEKEIRNLNPTRKSAPIRLLKNTGNLISNLNEMVEGGVRLSLYKNMIDAGYNKEDAATASKELTVNFNRKGKAGSVLNSAYLFANASIQGTHRFMFRSLKSPRIRKIAAATVAMGFLTSLYNRLMNPDDWEKMSDYNRDNNWMFMLPNGKTLAFKVGYGLNVFKTTGNLMEELVMGEISMATAFSRFLGAVNTAFNPLGGGSLVQFFMPSMADPWIQIKINETFFGTPLMPDQPQFGKKMPDSQRYFKSARKFSIDLVKLLNELTGGSEEVSGFIDVSPESIDNLIDFYGGGLGKFIANAINTGAQILTKDEEIDINNVPIMRQFVKEPSEYKKAQTVYRMLSESGRHEFSEADQQRFFDALDSAVEDRTITPSRAEDYEKRFTINQKAARLSKKGYPSKSKVLDAYEEYYIEFYENNQQADPTRLQQLNESVARYNERAAQSGESVIDRDALMTRVERAYEKATGKKIPRRTPLTR